MNKETERLIDDAKANTTMNAINLQTTFFKYCFVLFIVASCLIAAQTKKLTERQYSNLADVQWLQKNLGNEDLIIIDASPAKVYITQHISRAINYDIFNYGPRELPVSEIEKKYQSWGISPEKMVLIYDQGGTYFATRLFFSLYYYGFPIENLFILDGGLSKWLEAGLPVTQELPLPVKEGTFTIKKLNEEVAPQLPEFLTASGDLDNNVLLEALEPNWHFGGLPFFDKNGHIPNAIMIPSSDYFNPDKTFKSAGEIEKMMTYLRVSSEKNIYTHCGGGIAASVPFFALKSLLKYPKVKLYKGSQLEWISDQRELPIWTYDAPYIMRETQWLKFWGGKTARMYGISNVNILDVRTEDEFHKGHLPFAINVPYEKFIKNINQLEKLDELLSTAGVILSEEVVIVSGKGLSEQSAIAFIVLEKLGQKKVSIFMDPAEKWEHLGFTLIKDTVSTESKTLRSESKNKTKQYPLNLRDGILITVPIEMQGIYPKVYIASGEKMDLNVADNKVIHLPYKNLLNVDGTPKSAYEIWTLISKSGVPRYAELICIAENLSEAAVNYFILKLMGFPDIKVLVI